MALPANLLLVRHGKSELNLAIGRSHNGDHSAFTPAFKNQHSSRWRLTPEGVRQAQITGAWLLREFGPQHFHRHYTSSYIRALETAGHLGLPNAQWCLDFYLRERQWGDLDIVSIEERHERFSDAWNARNAEPFYWRPPNGESLAETCLRVDRFIDTLHRECDGKNVIIVCHGEVLLAFRRRLERLDDIQFRTLVHSRDPKDKIENCHVFHYTRVDASSPDTLHPYLCRMRTLCPWKPESIERAVWRDINRKKYSNEELLAIAETVTPMIVE